MSDNFNKAFGLPEEPGRELDILQPAASNPEEDFKYARDNLYATIEHVRFALDDLAGFAKTAQSARVYEVLANMIKTSIDASKGLLDLQKQRFEMMEKAAQTGGVDHKTINNNLFLTTAEFQKLVEEHKKEQDGD